MMPLRIGIIIGTIREGRFGDTPAAWIADHVSRHPNLVADIVDLRDYRLPLYGDPHTSDADDHHTEAIQQWGQKMEEFDGYIFVTAEYNHSISSPLKNALDYLDGQLHRKPAAFVGYGGVGGARGVEQLRQILVEFRMVPLRNAVHITMAPYLAVLDNERSLDDFEDLGKRAVTLVDDLGWWASALRAARLPAGRGRTAPREAIV